MTLWSWGLNAHGQLGMKDQMTRICPQRLPFNTSLSIHQIVCGSRFTLLVTTSGQVWTWGKNDEGQLGLQDQHWTSMPRLVSSLTEISIMSVSAKGSHVLAITKFGEVFAWGRGDEGQLGNGKRVGSNTPYKIKSLSSWNIIQVSCGKSHSLALDAKGRVLAWGCGDEGQLGRGDTKSAAEPHRIVQLDGINVVAIDAGSRHSLALTTNGQVYAWGWGYYGQIGRGDCQNSTSPVHLSAFEGRFVKRICCGFRHNLAEVQAPIQCSVQDVPSVDIWAWGWNQYGQLGISPTTTTVCTPAPIPHLKGITVLSMAAGGRHSIVSLSRHVSDSPSRLRARAETDPMNVNVVDTVVMGRGDDGQLGYGEVSDTWIPLRIPSFKNREVKQVACGWSHTCAVTDSSDYFLLPKRRNSLPTFQWIAVGDADGFFAMLVQCIIQLMIIFQILPIHCGLSIETITANIIPSVAASTFLGHLFFGIQGVMLSRKEGRVDVTAQPHGVNTVLIFAYMLLIMAPEYQLTRDAEHAWETGIFAATMTGMLQMLLLPFVRFMKRTIPRAAMLASTSGVALTFLSMGFAFQIWQDPPIAIGPLMLVIICYGSGVKLPYKIPVGLGALLLGTILAFTLYYTGAPTSFTPFTEPYTFQINFPCINFSRFARAMTGTAGWKYMSVIVPMALVNIMSDLANLENAASVNDHFDPTLSILGDCIVTLMGALLGCPFPTGIFIGHPVYKSMGARSGYLLFNAIAIALIALFNATSLILDTVPVASGAGFLMWVGLMITAKSFEQDPKSDKNHSVAVAFGLIPGLAAWAWKLVQTAIHTVTTMTQPQTVPFTMLQVVEKLSDSGINPIGMIALSQGYLLTSIVLAATVVHIIEREFLYASIWMCIAALLSFLGVIHSFIFTDQNTIGSEFGFFPGGWHGYAVQYGVVYLGVASLLLMFYIRENEIPWIFFIKRNCIFPFTLRKKNDEYCESSPLLPGPHRSEL